MNVRILFLIFVAELSLVFAFYSLEESLLLTIALYFYQMG